MCIIFNNTILLYPFKIKNWTIRYIILRRNIIYDQNSDFFIVNVALSFVTVK